MSRVLGFARDAATAAVLGAGPLADALLAALTLPLFARRLLAEGAFNAAFLPGLAAAPGKREIAAARGTLIVLTGLLAVLALVAAYFMPALISVLAPGFETQGERWSVAVACGRIAILYLPVAGAAAVFGGMANRAHRVLLPALAPVFANLVVLAAIVALVLHGMADTPYTAWLLATATLFAGIAQFVTMLVAAHGSPVIAPTDGAPNMGHAFAILRAAVPAFLFSGIAQLRLLIAIALVSAVPGAVAAMTYAQRLIDLPLGLVGASAGAVLVPILVSAHRDDGRETARATLAALALALPAAVGLAVLAEPIVATLYQRGSFSAEDSRITGLLLAGLALSLPAQGLERVLSAAACANGLTGPAERIAAASLALCVLAGLALGSAFGPLGVAAAVSLSSIASLLAMGIVLVRRGLLAANGAFYRAAFGLCAAAFAMGAAVWSAGTLWPLPAPQTLAGFVRLGALVGIGMAVYGALAFGLRRRFFGKA